MRFRARDRRRPQVRALHNAPYANEECGRPAAPYRTFDGFNRLPAIYSIILRSPQIYE